MFTTLLSTDGNDTNHSTNKTKFLTRTVMTLRVFSNETKRKKCFLCRTCEAVVATVADNVLSKDFVGRSGKAYLFAKCRNLYQGEAYSALLLTGEHVVAKVFCACCRSELGWKYVDAASASQSYKVGKVCLELPRLRKVVLS